MAGSIQRRLISITSLILVIFLTSTGWVLDRTYSASIVQGAEEQLKLVIYALMGIAEEEGASLGVQSIARRSALSPSRIWALCHCHYRSKANALALAFTSVY